MIPIFPEQEKTIDFTKPSEIRFDHSYCRFCGKKCRALHNNGIIGPGYKEWNYVCESCGRVQ